MANVNQSSLNQEKLPECWFVFVLMLFVFSCFAYMNYYQNLIVCLIVGIRDQNNMCYSLGHSTDNDTVQYTHDTKNKVTLLG